MKKCKRSIVRKQRALDRYVEAIEEIYGPKTSQIDRTRVKKNYEVERGAIRKGIDKLKSELGMN